LGGLSEGGTPESIKFRMPEISRGFLSIKRHNFIEKVVGIWSKKQSQGAVVLYRFSKRLAACLIWVTIVFAGSQLS